MPRTGKSARDSSSSGRSWWSILARTTSSRKARDKEETVEASLSIKERVLAKLAEPIPHEIAPKQGRRYSVDALGMCYSERAPAPAFDADEAAEQLCGTPARYSTSSSSYWSSLVDTAEATASSNCNPPRSVHTSCTSPNVIARLMGLGDSSPAHGVRKKLPVADRNAATVSEERKWGRHSRQSQRKNSCYAQGFLDEMEDHLRQCDQALERIEAVMQLKKKLLYLNTSSTAARTRYDVYSLEHKSKPCHARSRSMDQNAMKLQDHQHHLKDKSTTVEISKASASFRHRRSFSDGATPVFCPYEIELDMTTAGQSAVRRARNHGQTLSSPIPRREQIHHDIAPPDLEKQTRLAGVMNIESEQPSPVSVLDNNDSSEDDPAPDYHQRQGEQKPPARKKSAAARALWADEPSTPATKVITRQECGGGNDDDDDKEIKAEVVSAMSRRWSQGISAEAKEVAARVECIILRRLVEETIVAVALGCARHRGRTRGDP